VNGLSAIYSLQRAPMDIDKPHFFNYAAETVFLRLKDQNGFKFENKKLAVERKIKTYR
jgi:hypothetical protein